VKCLLHFTKISSIWSSWPDIYYCLAFTVLFLWGALSGERTGLPFVLLYAAGPFQAVFHVSESLGTRDHILLSQIWDFPFRRLLRLAGSRWRYSTPPPHGCMRLCVVSSAYIGVMWTGYQTSFLKVPFLLFRRSAVTQRVFGCSSPGRFVRRFGVVYATAHCYCVTLEVPTPNTLHYVMMRLRVTLFEYL
jgi:hypothetical protein